MIAYEYIYDSFGDLDVWEPNRSIKDENYWTTFTSDLFIVVKACVE